MILIYGQRREEAFFNVIISKNIVGVTNATVWLEMTQMHESNRGRAIVRVQI